MKQILRSKPARRSVTFLLLLGSWGASAEAAVPAQRMQLGARAPVGPTSLIPPPAQPFATGYERSEATATPPGEVTWMVFQNTSSLPQAFPWTMSIFYESPGQATDRRARIVNDPTGVSNKVLHYWLKNAVIPSGYQNHTKGRIQTGFSAPLDDAVEIYSKQRMYIHPDMSLLNSYPANGDPWWLGILIQELWSGANWLGDAFPSRISLTVGSVGGQLRLGARCHSANTSAEYWNEWSPTYVLPTGEWLTIEMGYRMGDANTGRFVIVIQRDGSAQREVVFDITGWTYDPLADGAGGPGPRSVTHWNPQKLYTSDNLVHFIRDNGGVAQIYWDDFAFGGSWPPSWP